MREIGILGNWKLSDVTPEDIAKGADDSIQRLGKTYEAVGKVPKGEVNYENTIKVRRKSTRLMT